MAMGYVDADGHIWENERELNDFLPEPFSKVQRYKLWNMLPFLDDFHTPWSTIVEAGGAGGPFDDTVGAERWQEFLDKTGLEYTVLYPTFGLAYGKIVNPDWAAAYAKGYNDWLHAKYLEVSPRFKGMALIPMQDVPRAVRELRRAVKELGMVGAMLPSFGLPRHLSHKEFWPVYEEAERLDCALGVHGGGYKDLGFNSFTCFPATRALGMPFPLAIAMTGMIVDGVFDAFPNLRVGFMEGGTSWIPLVIDRLKRETEYTPLTLKRSPEEYFRRVFVGCEGNEEALSYCIQRVGHEPFMFASDFPHEIMLENCMEEIDEIRERKDLEEHHKRAILGENARRFYKQ